MLLFPQFLQNNYVPAKILFFWLIAFFGLLALLNPELVRAQIIPDGTIPTSVQQTGNMQEIIGGERVGDNLFHSFEQFSVLTGSEAIFKNAIDVKNIFTRVTGGEVSSIDGLIQTQGGANLFLINSNGIIFGEFELSYRQHSGISRCKFKCYYQ